MLPFRSQAVPRGGKGYIGVSAKEVFLENSKLP